MISRIDPADLRLRFLLPHLREPLEVQAVQQIVVDAGLQVLVTRAVVGQSTRLPIGTTGFMSLTLLAPTHLHITPTITLGRPVRRPRRPA